MHRVDDLLKPAWARVLVGIGAVGVSVTGRVVIEALVPDVIPFTLTFPAVIAAALLGGWLSGLTTIIGCQLLVWYYVIPPRGAFHFVATGDAVSLILATLSQLLAVYLVVIARGAAVRRHDETRQRLDLAQTAMHELDHRTKNNFQIAASLLEHQARTAGPEAAEQLRIAANRLHSIATTYHQLGLASDNLAEIDLLPYIESLCDKLRDSIVPPWIRLTSSGEAVVLPASVAGQVGLLITEWVTNAVKHAFPNGGGTIAVSLHRSAEVVRIDVADNGVGIDAGRSQGSGTSLIRALAANIGGTAQIAREDGTRCSLEFPLLHSTAKPGEGRED